MTWGTLQWGAFMYYKEDRDQLGIEEFFLPFGGKLQRENRWVKMAEIMPWNLIEDIYLKSMNQEKGRGAYSARMAYGAIFIKEHEGLTDEQTVTVITENPYMQYFLCLSSFIQKPPFDASMMVHFRKRFPVEDLAVINEAICTGKTPDKTRKVDHNDSDDHDDTPPSGGGRKGKPGGEAEQEHLEEKAEAAKEESGEASDGRYRSAGRHQVSYRH